MANFLTSNTLIESVKNRALIPENQVTFQTEDFLRFANEEMIIGIVPTILLYHEDYLLYTEEKPLVAGISNYKIPYRAIGNKLREVSYKDNNGNVYEMSRILIEDLPSFQQDFTTRGSVRHYYVKNNEIVLVPEVNENPVGSLLFSYYFRPNNLVEEDRVAIIQNINTTTGEIFVDEIPENFSSDELYDFIKIETPFKNLNFDVQPVSLNTTTNVITFNVDDIPSELSEGDHIALATETIIPQIPSDLHVMLAHRVSLRCLEALGDTQGLQNASAKMQEMETKMPSLIDNRVEGSPIKISNRWSPMRISSFRRRWSRRR